MKITQNDDGWRKRFAFLPIYLSGGPKKTVIWLEWVWVRDAGLYREVSLNKSRAAIAAAKGHDHAE